jgi:hypothetical protein
VRESAFRQRQSELAGGVIVKVALCLSGLPRFLNQTQAYWHQCIIDPYDADVFVHSWTEPTAHSSIQQTILQLYQPKAAEFGSIPQFDVSSYKDRIWPHRITPSAQFSQFSSIQRAQRLRQNYEKHHEFEYDIVVRARFDWYLEKVDFEINKCVNVPRTPTLDGHVFTYCEQQLVGISDQFAYGSSAAMTVYGNLVDRIPHLYHNCGVDFCGELFLRAHLHEQNLSIKQHRWNHGIVRDWGVMP